LAHRTRSQPNPPKSKLASKLHPKIPHVLNGGTPVTPLRSRNCPTRRQSRRPRAKQYHSTPKKFWQSPKKITVSDRRSENALRANQKQLRRRKLPCWQLERRPLLHSSVRIRVVSSAVKVNFLSFDLRGTTASIAVSCRTVAGIPASEDNKPQLELLPEQH